MVLCLRPTFEDKNRSVLCSFKNAVPALQTLLHDGHVAGQAEACLCMDWQMDIICILMFFCSYVLIMIASCFVFLKNAVLALQIFCMMGMWLDRQELAYA